MSASEYGGNKSGGIYIPYAILAVSISVLVSVFAAWTNLNAKISTLDERSKNQADIITEMKSSIITVRSSVNTTNEKLANVKGILENLKK